VEVVIDGLLLVADDERSREHSSNRKEGTKEDYMCSYLYLEPWFGVRCSLFDTNHTCLL